MQGDDPRHDVLDVHRPAHARPLPGEVEQRLDDTPGPQGLRLDDRGGLLLPGLRRVAFQDFRERSDGGEWVVQLMGHSRHQAAELREPVGFQDLALQQQLARRVDREKQELRRSPLGLEILDDRIYLADGFAREVHREPEPLPLRDGLAQRGPQRRTLRCRHPVGERPPAQGPHVRGPEQGYSLGVRFQNLAVHAEDERGDGEDAEQPGVEPSLFVERRHDRARLPRQLRPDFPEQQVQPVSRPPAHLGFEERAFEFGGVSRRQVGARLAIDQHILEHPLGLRGPGRREGGPEGLAEDPVGGEPRDPRRRRVPLHDRPVGGDGGRADVRAVLQGFAVHRPPMPGEQLAPSAVRGLNRARLRQGSRKARQVTPLRRDRSRPHLVSEVTGVAVASRRPRTRYAPPDDGVFMRTLRLPLRRIDDACDCEPG